VREILKVAEQPEVLSFAGGLPAPELFPVAELAEAFARVLAREGAAALQYSTTEGFGPLRAWVAARLGSQGIHVDVEDTLITNGSQQGIDLAARVLVNPGDRVAVEDPSYLAALQVFAGHGARFAPVASDEHGLVVEDLERVHAVEPVRLVYVASGLLTSTAEDDLAYRLRELFEGLSSVIVAKITCLLSMNRIPSFRLRHALRSELLPRSLLRIGSTSRKNDIAQIASSK
jgi:2-aminoadipate transaminase